MTAAVTGPGPPIPASLALTMWSLNHVVPNHVV